MFLADLARRILLLTGLLIFLVPLTSLSSSGLRLTAVQLTEAVVLAFIVVALTRSILDGRLFMDSRLARPAMAVTALVGVSGLCSAFEQTADAGVAIRGLWRSATSYFVSPDANYMLQPTLQWLELAVLAPLVELSVRRLRLWREAAGGLRPGKALSAPLIAVLVVLVLIVASAVVLGPARGNVGLALEAARQAPMFGIGPGGAIWAVPNPESSYWLPLVILIELGCIGLVTFVWLVWSAVKPAAVGAPARTARTVVVSGAVACFLLAMFVNPSLVYPAVAVMFVMCGFAAGMLPVRAPSPAQSPRLWAEWIVLGVVLISAPWRISEALSPGTPEVVGAGPVQPEIEGVGYRVVEPVSRWRLDPRTRTVVALMRWDPARAFQCRVRIAVRNRPADEVSLRSDMWIPVRFAIPPGSRPNERPEVEFHVSGQACRLFVGTVTATR